jgi:hypothetical protein
MPDDSEPTDDGSGPLWPGQVTLGTRFNEYLDVWDKAASRLIAADYHSEDLIDDWFALWGKWMRDAAAAATVAWRSYAAESVNRPSEGAPDAES